VRNPVETWIIFIAKIAWLCPTKNTSGWRRKLSLADKAWQKVGPCDRIRRKRWESQHPQVAQSLRHLADAHAQQDPTFRTSLTYTRLTAQAALQALREQGYAEQELPSPSTMAEVLNRMGYRLRKMVKAKPQKKIKETDSIFDNIKKKTNKPGRLKGPAAGASIVKPR
jgi:hypothetical protein